MTENSDEKPDEPDEFARFKKFARALFRVDKRDIPKHEPKKRKNPSPSVSHD